MDYKRILVFGAHPDDEIAMAGTMKKLSDMGVEVHVCTSTDGCEGYPRPELKDQIVEIRRKEERRADEVMGVTQRHHIGSPDMALVNDKDTFLKFIEVIRRVRPNAAFTHGPDDRHRDHINTCEISLEALWQAGQPVAAEIAKPWKTEHVYFYKAVRGQPPHIHFDCTGYAHIRHLARATQKSQMTLWGLTSEELRERAERIKQQHPEYAESFWLTERMVLSDFPDLKSN